MLDRLYALGPVFSPVCPSDRLVGRRQARSELGRSGFALVMLLLIRAV